MQQTELDFTTASPINQDKLTGQNKRVYEWLKSGKTITRPQAQAVGITALNSRISDLRNRVKINEVIHSRYILLPTGSMVKEYSLTPFKDNN